MPVTEQLGILPFTDGTHATVSWILDVAGGTIQHFMCVIPVGHHVTIHARDATGKTLFSTTVTGTGMPVTVAVPTPWATGRGQPGYQMSFSGN